MDQKKIKCNVESCEYNVNNCECGLNSIQVGCQCENCEACHDDTVCDSFKEK